MTHTMRSVVCVVTCSFVLLHDFDRLKFETRRSSDFRCALALTQFQRRQMECVCEIIEKPQLSCALFFCERRNCCHVGEGTSLVVALVARMPGPRSAPRGHTARIHTVQPDSVPLFPGAPQPPLSVSAARTACCLPQRASTCLRLLATSRIVGGAGLRGSSLCLLLCSALLCPLLLCAASLSALTTQRQTRRMGACVSTEPPIGSTISSPKPAFPLPPPPRIVSSDGRDIAAIRDAFEAHLNRLYLRLHHKEKRRQQREKDRAERWAKRSEEIKAEDVEIASINHAATRTQSHTPALECATDGRRTSSRSSLRQQHSGAGATPTPATLSLSFPVASALTSAVSTSLLAGTVAAASASEDEDEDESLDRLDDADLALPATALGWDTPVMVVPGALAWPPGILHRVCAAEAERPDTEPPLDPEVELEKRKAEIARECEDLDPKCTTIFVRLQTSTRARAGKRRAFASPELLLTVCCLHCACGCFSPPLTSV